MACPIQYREIAGTESGMDGLGNASQATLVWAVTGTDDPLVARQFLQDNNVVPLVYDGLTYNSLTREWVGETTWEFTAAYIDPQKAEEQQDLQEVGDKRITFDTTGGSATVVATDPDGVTIYNAAGVVTPTPGTPEPGAPDYKGLLGVEVDSSGAETPTGREIIIPSFKWQIQFKTDRLNLTDAYVRTVAILTGGVNDATFYGFQAGELLFLGATGLKATQSDPEINYQFDAKENRSIANGNPLKFGDVDNVEADGQDIVWPKYRTTTEDTGGGVTVNTTAEITAVYVHQLPRVDFSLLGIGT